MSGLKTVSVLLALAMVSATAATAQPKAYVYSAPAPVAVTSALQNRATGFDTTAPDPTMPAPAVTPIDTRPGLIRPASELATARHDDDNRRAFACADKKCKTTTPVFNSETPLQREQGMLGSH